MDAVDADPGFGKGLARIRFRDCGQPGEPLRTSIGCRAPAAEDGGLTAQRDLEFTEYVHARLTWLRRLAYLLCQDWNGADDLVQATLTQLYVHWGRARAADQIDGYVRGILVREFLRVRRSAWARRVVLAGPVPEAPVLTSDRDAAVDVRGALSRLPPRQRVTLVLRFYCDLSVDQTAQMLGCSAGTVKSQTSKGLGALRRMLAPAGARPQGGSPASPGGHPARLEEEEEEESGHG
jgi:RNA polymerase sigma-70 factor (sigma-E family)